MHVREWNLPDAVGRDVFFWVTDRSTGSWGHITVDSVVFTGEIGVPDFGVRAAELAKLAAAETERELQRTEKAIKTVASMHSGEILYVTHAQFARDHHNTATLFQCGEINGHKYTTQGALKAWNPTTGKVRVIIPEKQGRTLRNPDVSYDGKTIVFSMRNGISDGYHIYTVNADEFCGDRHRRIRAESCGAVALCAHRHACVCNGA